MGEDSEEYVLRLQDNIATKTTLLDLMMLKLSSIPMHVLNLIAEEKSKLANKWKTTFCSLMKGNMGIQKHSKLFVSLV